MAGFRPDEGCQDVVSYPSILASYPWNFDQSVNVAAYFWTATGACVVYYVG